MVKYQIQYKEKVDMRGCNADEYTPRYSGSPVLQTYAEELKTCYLREELSKQHPMIAEYSNGGHGRVVAELPTLQAAIIAAKALIKKYGYDRIQICKVTALKVNVTTE